MADLRFFLGFRVFGALLAACSLVGCYSAGDDDGDDDGGGACASFCSWNAGCGEDADGTCTAECNEVYASGEMCRASIDQLSSCVRANPACDAATSACSAETNAILTNCDGGGGDCAFTNDGDCDEPEGTGICAEGTDVVDCATVSPTCAYTNNGSCDEPEGTGLCAEGTDVIDCSTSSTTCVFADDGECDEPEGTGFCAEGTDVNDCAAP